MSRSDILRASSHAKLDLRELQSLDMELRRRTKSKETMWTLWAFLSYFGAHRYYLGDFGYATAMFLTSFVPMIGLVCLSILTDVDEAAPTFWFWFFVFWLGASVLWSWIDAFFISNRVDKLNDLTGREILAEIVAQRNEA